MRKPWLFFLEAVRHRRNNRVDTLVGPPAKLDPHDATTVTHCSKTGTIVRSKVACAESCLHIGHDMQMLQDVHALQVRMEGPDVASERRRVEGLGRGDADTAIVLRDLCKVYPAEVCRCLKPVLRTSVMLEYVTICNACTRFLLPA